MEIHRLKWRYEWRRAHVPLSTPPSCTWQASLINHGSVSLGSKYGLRILLSGKLSGAPTRQMGTETNVFTVPVWMGIDQQEGGREKTHARHFLSVSYYNWLAYANSHKLISKQSYQSHFAMRRQKHRNKKQTKSPPSTHWKNKSWYLHTDGILHSYKKGWLLIQMSVQEISLRCTISVTYRLDKVV